MSNSDLEQEVVSSTQAAAILGVHVASIKRWADQGRLRCIKTPGGHRRFLRADVEAMGEQSRSADGFRKRLLSALIAGRQMNAESILLEHWEEMGRWETVGDAVGVMLEEMGEAWSNGLMNITEEHVASETLSRALGRLEMMVPRSQRASTCVLATAPGDEHTLGLAMTELVLAEHGWKSLWLGRYSPISTLCELAARSDIGMIAVSASAFSSLPKVLSDLVCRVGPVAQASGTQLVLGGSGAWPAGIFGSQRIKSYADFGLLLRSREAS